MTRTQTTTAQVAAHVADVAERVADLPFRVTPNGFGFHARCTECGDGFSESRGTVTVGTLQRHALSHAVA